MHGSHPQKIGCLTIKTGNDTMREAAEMPRPQSLFPHLVFEGECSCLFSDTNVGKSIFAVQMGDRIASQGKIVAYYDFELSPQQFRIRCSGEDGAPHLFPGTFYRIEINAEGVDEKTDIMASIEQSAQAINSDVLIIDNLSWLCMDSEDASSANALMKAIKSMQIRHGWTIIVVAHTPKRNETMPLSVNDLAGSRQLANFFDSIFALGRCVTDNHKRYLKQLKVRIEEPLYTSQNVYTCEIGRRDNMLQMIGCGFSTEKAMLRSEEDIQADNLAAHIKELYNKGMDVKEISAETGESISKIQKIVRK